MVRALRAGLDGHWLLAWDQEVPGWSRAVTIVVGPSGIWVLWAPDRAMTWRVTSQTLSASRLPMPSTDLTKVLSWAGRPWRRQTAW